MLRCPCWNVFRQHDGSLPSVRSERALCGKRATRMAVVDDSQRVSHVKGGRGFPATTGGRSLISNSCREPPSFSSLGVPAKTFQFRTKCVGQSVGRVSSEEAKKDDETLSEMGVREEMKESQFVHWFREAWPYIQGYRSSIFVLVLPGEVIANRTNIDGILQDILLLHGLGIKLVIIPGTHVQIDKLLVERGHQPQYSGPYRITDAEALAASMEAAGRIRLDIEAKLSRGPSIPSIRRHGDNDRWHEVSVASGNFLAAKRRGVVNGVDFGATGEVKRIDTARIKERLDSNCIVMLTNLGYSATGEVLNCNTYEVATACAVALQADKMMCLLDGPIHDDDSRLVRFLTLQEADKLIRDRASGSNIAAEYVRAVAGPAYVQSLGLQSQNGSSSEAIGKNGSSGMSGNIGVHEGSVGSSPRNAVKGTYSGFAIGGEERQYRLDGFLSELTAAVFVCRNGVRRVHLLDSNVQGALFLELYTRDGIGTMISSDTYEGTRPANHNDIYGIMELMRPLEDSGILVSRPRKQLEQEVKNYTVVERDGSIIACAGLFPYYDEKCGEVAAFAVAPECRGHGIGDALIDFIERKAATMKLNKLFLLTTRTADWFVHRGFSECTVASIPEARRQKINLTRGSKYYMKNLKPEAAYIGNRR